MLDLSAELRRRHFGLWLVGALNFAACAVFLVLLLFDDRTVTAINVWIKPVKFAVSVGIYLWTVAWLLPHLRVPRWLSGGIGWGIAVAMFFENALVFSQAVRGVSSHFNRTAPYDEAVFAFMGMLIAVNSVFIVAVFLLFLVRPRKIPRPYLWGIRLGLLVLILGSAQGGLMIANDAHTVGAEDGGPGLPFLGWSTEAGDLRAAHLIGLHGLQVLPLLGWWASRRKWPDGRQTALVFALSAAYAALGAALFWQAQLGRPLIPL